MSHWERGPAFPSEECLNQQKNILTKEYLSKGMSGMEKTGKGGIASGGVGPHGGPSTDEPWGSCLGAVGQDLDAMETPSSW